MRTLVAHGVRFVVIGGFAGSLRGSPVITGDLDICYARDRQNLEGLAEALRELGAHLRGPGVPEDLPFQLDPETFELGDRFTFITAGGKLDVMGVPSGTRGFDDLDAGADTLEVDGLEARVASLDDLIAMKEAARRDKDMIHLEWLRSLRDMIDRGDVPT
ncbi:MAG: hypothetical protein ABR600_11640 [Actinomycetota bacterium]